jgi:RES domain-containing protein
MQHWRGAAYRVTTPDYPSPKDILLGQGSFLFGGRWNAAGSFRAVYGSVSDTVAVAESRANAEYAAMPFPFRTPRLLVTLELNLEKLIDLTQPETIQLLDLEQEELRAEDWRKVQAEGRESLSQCFGRAVFESGANGLLAPSARVPGGVNVVYMPENRCRASEAKVFEPEKLERIARLKD